jgi:hypothetical protein
MSPQYQNAIATSAQAAALVAFASMLVFGLGVTSQFVTVTTSDAWESSDPGLHSAWKLALGNPLEALKRQEDRI